MTSINQWAFPYPDKMSLEQCLRLAKDAGFDGIELNYDLENDLSPNAGTKEFHAIGKDCVRYRFQTDFTGSEKGAAKIPDTVS